MLLKKINIKQLALKFEFFNEKKTRKIQMIFEVEN